MSGDNEQDGKWWRILHLPSEPVIIQRDLFGSGLFVCDKDGN